MNLIIFLLFQLTLFVHASLAQVKYPSLSQEGYFELVKMVNEINKVCPSPDCLVVFPGRSNVLLSAYMEAKNTHHVSLPVSGLRSIEHLQVDQAKKRFFSEVLDVNLKSNLSGIKKLLIVDYVNGGGTITTTAVWLKEYFKTQQPLLQIDVMGYGKGIGLEHQKTLFENHIPHHYLSTENKEGTPTKLAEASQLEHHAAFGEWNPSTTQGKPAFNSKLQRPYPYFNENHEKPFQKYASYDDLIQWFQKEPFKPALFKPDCLTQTLGSML